MQNHSSVTSAYVQTAWFIILRSEQQAVSFPDLFIRNQGVSEMFEQNTTGSQKIETVTLFGVAQRHLLFRMLRHVLDYLSSLM